MSSGEEAHAAGERPRTSCVVDTSTGAAIVLDWFDLRSPALQCDEALEPAERARAARLIDDVRRRRYVASHVALRRLLAERLALPAGELAIDAARSSGGKPRLSDRHRSSLRFSLSRSDDVAVIAVCDGFDVGVDVEHDRDVFVTRDFAELALSAAERSGLDTLPDAARAMTARRLWVRKEAVLKALGTGLAVAPSAIETSDVATTSWPQTLRGLGIRWLDIEIPVEGVAAALAWRIA